jgi:hypothetical protein
VAVELAGASPHAAPWQLLAGLCVVRGQLSQAARVCDVGYTRPPTPPPPFTPLTRTRQLLATSASPQLALSPHRLLLLLLLRGLSLPLSLHPMYAPPHPGLLELEPAPEG